MVSCMCFIMQATYKFGTFQNAWGEHGGKIQMNPKPEKDTYGGGLPQGPLTVNNTSMQVQDGMFAIKQCLWWQNDVESFRFAYMVVG